MPQRVRVLEFLMPRISQHPSRHDFWVLHDRLVEAEDPFDPDEVGCVPAPEGLRRESIIRYEGMTVHYWEHPDGDVEIIYVSLPE